MIRKLAKYSVALIAYYSGLLFLANIIYKIIVRPSNVVILMYHRVLDRAENGINDDQPGLVVSSDIFERQMEFLSKRYNIISLTDYSNLIRNTEKPPANCAVITFDDGWRDNYTNAYPVLKKYQIPATIFPAVDYIDSENSFWFSRVTMVIRRGNISPAVLADILNEKTRGGRDLETIDVDGFIEELKHFDSETIGSIIDDMESRFGGGKEDSTDERQMLSWDEVIEMSREKIEFGSHGLSHRILTGLNREEILREMTESKKILEAKIGSPVTLFSYPNGNFNTEIKHLAEKSGYSCAVATGIDRRSGKDLDPFSFPRINVHDGISVSPRGEFSPAMFMFHIYRNLMR